MNDTRIGRRDFLKIGAAAAATAALDPLAAAAARPDAAKRPNVIFVFSDEHRWCSMPFTETPSVVAPNMERMAREGMRLDNCFSTSPICVPYRGMLITGQWPHQSGCISNNYFANGDVIGLDAPTIAHTFTAGGYVTGYVGKWHLKNQTCVHAGFDYFQHWLYGDEHWKTQVRDVIAGEQFKTVEGYNAAGMTDQALTFIRRHAAGDKPFLMMLSINPPHYRWDDAPEEFLAKYPPEDLAFRPNVTDAKYKQGSQRSAYRHYHAHISAVDRELGRLMDALKELGIDDNTVLIYTSDHGSSWGSNGVSNKGNPYDEAIRVPFIVRWPGRVPAGRVVDNLIGTPDLHATLCGLAGLTPSDHCGGEDFSPVLLGKAGADPKSQLVLVNNFQRNYYHRQLNKDHSTWYCPFRGVRTKRYTYVVNADGDWLLYDNQNDPYQRRNLVGDPAHAKVKAELRRELDRQLARAEDPFIPDAWRKCSLPDRIATQNEYYAVLRAKRQWDRYKFDAVATYVTERTTDAKKAQLVAAADRTFDARFFGPYLALRNELQGRKRYSRRPPDDIRRELAAHEAEYAALFEAAARKIRGD